MFLSSLIVAKPGGMTIFEGVYYKKPFIFTHYIPGQERENMEVLIDAGVALFANKQRSFRTAVKTLSQKHNQLNNRYPLRIDNIQSVLTELVGKCLSKNRT